MSLDSLFPSAPRSNPELAAEIRRALNDLRRRPLMFGAGCGCGVAFSAVSAREFEEILVFHVTERWRPTTPGNNDTPVVVNDVEGLLDLVLALDRAGKATECRAMLEEIRRSVLSFVQQCSRHGFKAENV
jgi:hypothetical protein